MATSSKGKQAATPTDGDLSLGKSELEAFIAEISKNVLASSGNTMHSMLAINQILRSPEAPKFIDGELKEQLKDVWIKLKSTGLQLEDPPLLFGVPPLPAGDEEEESLDTNGQ